MNKPMLYRVDPGVAAEAGAGTRYRAGNVACLADDIEFLHVMLDQWPGPELLSSETAFVVTEHLANALRRAGMTGFGLEAVKVGRTDNMRALHRGMRLPRLYRLVPFGRAEYTARGDVLTWSGHDVCFGDCADYTGAPPTDWAFFENGLLGPFTLVVTRRCLQVLGDHHLPTCSIGGLRLPAGLESSGERAAAPEDEAHETADLALCELDPEWQGTLGEATIYGAPPLHLDGHIPVRWVERVDWSADGAVSAGLIRCGSALLVAEVIVGDLRAAGMTGLALAPIVSKDGDYQQLIPTGRAVCDALGFVVSWSGEDICLGRRLPGRVHAAPVPGDPRGWYPLQGPYGLFVSRRCWRLMLRHNLGTFQLANRPIDYERAP